MSKLNWGELIREYRKAQGLTVREFAYKYGVTTQAVYLWESNKSQAPNRITLLVLGYKMRRR